jgi:sulfatase modifying factor 1
MLGNVAEWVSDWYGSRYCRVARYADPQGPRSGKRRAVRGGGYFDVSFTVFVWSRDAESPEAAFAGLGFRCARENLEP